MCQYLNNKNFETKNCTVGKQTACKNRIMINMFKDIIYFGMPEILKFEIIKKLVTNCKILKVRC